MQKKWRFPKKSPKRIKRGWLVVILAPAMVFPELVPFILIEKGVKVNLFLLFF